MARSQKPVRGLVDHAGLYNFGSIPLEVNESVQPTLEFSQFFQPSEWVYGTPNNVFAAGTVLTAFVVPADEFWMLNALGFKTDNVGIGVNTLMWQPVLVAPNGFHGMALGTPFSHGGNDQQFATSVNMWCGYQCPQPLRLAPGTLGGISFPVVGSPATEFFPSAIVQKFKI